MTTTITGMTTTITGYAIRFNELSEDLGNFRERIAPGAVDRTLRTKIDLRALSNHNVDKVLARLSAGTLRVEKDAHGLRFELDAPNSPTGCDVVEGVRRRDLTGASFAFQALSDQWDDRHGGLPVRTVTDAEIREVSICSWPAYPTTSVNLRALLPARRGAAPRRDTVTARLEAAAAGPSERRSMEFAMLKNSSGQLVPHDEGRAALKRFLDAKQEAGGRRPIEKDGTPMTYRSTLTPQGWRGEWASRHLSLAQALVRQHAVERLITRERQARQDETVAVLLRRREPPPRTRDGRLTVAWARWRQANRGA